MRERRESAFTALPLRAIRQDLTVRAERYESELPMALRCLLLSNHTGTRAEIELCTKLRAALGAETVNFRLRDDPDRAPSCSFALLRLESCPRPELRHALTDLEKFAPRLPALAVCDYSLQRWADDIARSSVRDFLFEPYSEKELGARIVRVLERSTSLPPAVETRPSRTSRPNNLIGNSPKFVAQCDRLASYAACNATVLILGETGTGKEIFAQALHYTSPRAAHPWIAVNCGAIPNDLIEDELFGHVRGAYTTAHAKREGLVKEAEGGSLFLDDVDCLPLPAQTKLLRFLQEREFRAVGSNAMQRADVRVIAASNRDLSQSVSRGEFRQDLYYRLNVLPLALPALRERREDIPALAEHFVRHFARDLKRPIQGVSAGALRRMLMHDWPGNVRELQHVIERAVLLAKGPMLDSHDIDCGQQGDESPANASFRSMKAGVIENFERSYIEQLLGASGGNVTQAARAAGKNRRAFFELMRKYRIASDTFRAPSH
jgi:two-component system, NtrC family, response regulator GlrR